MSAKNEHGLTPAQERFAQEVARGQSLADAYRAAYPKAKSWKPETLYPKASEMMSAGKVLARVTALKDAAADGAVVDATKLVREMARLAFSDPRKLVGEKGKLKALSELDDDTAAAIASIEVDEYGKVKYKLWDKGPAQEKLAKYLGLYEKDNKQRTDPMAELAKALLGSVVGPGGLNLPEPASE